VAISCMFGFHDWKGCTCAKCGKSRNEEHDWGMDCEKCARCGAIRQNPHNWNGCKCAQCGKGRDESHSWEGCKCTQCGKTRDEDHSWDGCKCSACGKTRNMDHVWDGIKCKKCGSDVEFNFGGKVYVGNKIAELIHSLIQSVLSGTITRQEGCVVALDLVAALPPGMGWDLLKVLLGRCEPRTFIAPLYQLVKMKPEVYVEFAMYLVGDYSLDLVSNYSGGGQNVEGLNVLLDCLVDPRENVSNVAKEIFKKLRKNPNGSGGDIPTDLFDVDGWRKWQQDSSRCVEELREKMRKEKS
jgi:hypothetical protein